MMQRGGYQNLFLIILVLVTVTPCYFVAAAQECNTLISSTDGLAVSNGTQLTFNCTVHDDSKAPITHWMLPSVDGCMDGLITLSHKQTAQKSFVCGPFSAASTTSEGSCYTSILTVNASAELAGKVVECQNKFENLSLSATFPPVSMSTSLEISAVCNVYSSNSEKIEHFILSWNKLSPSGENSSELVINYTVFISNTTGGPDMKVCSSNSSNSCKFSAQDCYGIESCHVYLTGDFAPIMKSNEEILDINKKNDLFTLNMSQQNSSTVIATFSFPNGLNGSSKCGIDHGVSPDLLKTSESAHIDSGGENVTLVFLIPNNVSTYYYQASVITEELCVYMTGNIIAFIESEPNNWILSILLLIVGVFFPVIFVAFCFVYSCIKQQSHSGDYNVEV